MPEYHFTADWFKPSRKYWEQYVLPLQGKPNLCFLEIGSFEGRSAVWMLEYVLTDATSTLACIDTFSGGFDYHKSLCKPEKVKERFLHNIEQTGRKGQVQVYQDVSRKILPFLEPESYDLVYIDGSHVAKDVLEDAVVSHGLVKPGGLLIFDDYHWKKMESRLDEPKVAIDAFLKIYQREYTLLLQANQVFLQKKVQA